MGIVGVSEPPAGSMVSATTWTAVPDASGKMARPSVGVARPAGTGAVSDDRPGLIDLAGRQRRQVVDDQVACHRRQHHEAARARLGVRSDTVATWAPGWPAADRVAQLHRELLCRVDSSLEEQAEPRQCDDRYDRRGREHPTRIGRRRPRSGGKVG
jgi:hypothetical protein